MGKHQIISGILIAASSALFPQAALNAQALQQKLLAQYPLTTPTADNTDIVTAGCVLTFKKRGLTASVITSSTAAGNSFKDKDSQIKPSAFSSLRKFSLPVVSNPASTETRTFVNGEKMFVTKIDVDPVKDTITFGLISDAYNDLRYRANLRFDFPKGSLATADLPQVQPVLDQAIGVTPPDSGAAASPAVPAPAPAAPPTPAVTEVAPPMAPIPPPPPPPADPAPPKAIALGQSPDEVAAIMGPPVKIAKLGTKEIYYYKDMRVTFVNGKITDVQ